ncbi:hypothetical protein B0A55_06561 [Friedmanniomyces simplex]|uniref:DUF1275 domain protein n=1 Tax=Friedmanniomyces simplex TaxID=329884 RepID=A0A4U0X074_9PEZI|nr:hypothetical protein B0A55_06561 [Friedmanniomyces simplex]
MAPSNSYGTLSESDRAENGGVSNGTDGDHGALLGNKSDKQDGLVERSRRHMTADINKSVQVWGSFVSMQTGNTVYFGLGLADPHQANTRWIRAAISVASFCLGSFFFARYHRYLGSRKRWVMVSAYILQIIMMIAAALMVTLGPVTGPAGRVSIWISIPIALIAFQAAGQAVTSRVLGYSGLTGVVLTSIYCDLFSDPKLFAPLRENVERNRRATAALCVALGALLGGFWAHSEFGLSGALWNAVGLKALVIVAWFFWKAEAEPSP